jgi:hypothetical protein
MVVSGQLHAPAALPAGKQPPGAHCIGGDWVGPRVSLDAVEKTVLPLPEIEPRLGRPARSLIAI